jgi:hypothetical protein
VLPPTVHPTLVLHTVGWAQRHWRTSGRRAAPLPVDIALQISAVLEPFGYNAPLHVNGNGDGDTPHRQMNEAALANLDAWVPALQLYKVRRTARGYEAVAVWRPSSTGRPDQARSRNLKIVSEGLRDFGGGTSYTARSRHGRARRRSRYGVRILAKQLSWDTAGTLVRGLIGNFENWPVWLGIRRLIKTARVRLVAASFRGAAKIIPKMADDLGDDAESASGSADPLEPYTHVPGALGTSSIDRQHGQAAHRVLGGHWCRRHAHWPPCRRAHPQRDISTW